MVGLVAAREARMSASLLAICASIIVAILSLCLILWSRRENSKAVWPARCPTSLGICLDNDLLPEIPFTQFVEPLARLIFWCIHQRIASVALYDACGLTIAHAAEITRCLNEKFTLSTAVSESSHQGIVELVVSDMPVSRGLSVKSRIHLVSAVGSLGNLLSAVHSHLVSSVGSDVPLDSFMSRIQTPPFPPVDPGEHSPPPPTEFECVLVLADAAVPNDGLCLRGFEPLAVRSSEIVLCPPLRRLREVDFARALRRYAACVQRHGK